MRKISYTINMFSPKENVNAFEKLPPEFEEASSLFKDLKKKGMPQISALLSPMIRADFSMKDHKKASEIFDYSNAHVEAAIAINVMNIKWKKGECIPSISFEALFSLKCKPTFADLYKADDQLMKWQSKNGLLAEAISVYWLIDFWGTEGKDLTRGDYESSGLYFEDE